MYVDKISCFLDFNPLQGYMNTTTGRSDLLADCTKYNRMDLYEEVLKVWGNEPTVEEYIEPEKAFEELKEDKLNELNESFNLKISGSFTTIEGYIMQFDISDSIKMQGAITLMEKLGQTEGYLTQANDETVYNVPLVTMKEVLVEMLSAYAQCHAHKQELRTLINNAKTKEELDSIQITWPV